MRRCEHFPPVVWIDAVCIDQSNLEERNEQVQMMDLIYKSASYTTIWLGPAPAGAVPLYELSRAISIWKNSHSALLELEMKKPTPAIRQAYMRIASLDLGHNDVIDHLDTFMRILHCNWFRRMWIIQEAVLSRKLYISWAADEGVLEWFDFSRAYDTLNHHAIKFRREHIDSVAGLTAKQSAQVVKSLAAFYRTTYHLSNISNLRTLHSDGMELRLPSLLRFTFMYEASDPRDHVYGVLGMASNREFVAVDYDLSLNDVFVNTSRTLLEKHKDLSVFNIRGFSHEADLPSWSLPPRLFTSNTVYFTEPLGSLLDPEEPSYYASGGNFIPILHFPDSGTLSMSMIRLDALRFMGGLAARDVLTGKKQAPRGGTSFDLDTYEQVVREWIAEDMGAEFAELQKYWSTGEPFWRAFARTLHADIVCPENTKSVFRRLPEDFQPTEKTMEAFRRTSSAATLKGRTFALTTAMNLFCLVPEDALPGDVIAVAIGAETPYLLRPAGTDTYRFIGCAYVHEFMDGRALDLAEELGAEYEARPFKIV
jgi:hypothetical protein